MHDFVTRTALVTGANRGMGLAIAGRLAEAGNSVLPGTRDLKAGEEAAKSLRRDGRDIDPVRIDGNSVCRQEMTQ